MVWAVPACPQPVNSIFLQPKCQNVESMVHTTNLPTARYPRGRRRARPPPRCPPPCPGTNSPAQPRCSTRDHGKRRNSSDIPAMQHSYRLLDNCNINFNSSKSKISYSRYSFVYLPCVRPENKLQPCGEVAVEGAEVPAGPGRQADQAAALLPLPPGQQGGPPGVATLAHLHPHRAAVIAACKSTFQISNQNSISVLLRLKNCTCWVCDGSETE